MLFKIVQLFVGFFVVIEGEDGNVPIYHLVFHGAYRHGVGNGVVLLCRTVVRSQVAHCF